MANKYINLILVFLFFMMFFSQSILAVTNVSSCGVLSVNGETYNQISDITNDTLLGPCIEITASNIIFDGGGYFISSDDNQYGIKINSVDNVTINNVNVSVGSSGRGLVVSGSLNSSLTNNLVNNQLVGIYLNESISIKVQNNNCTGNYAGILISNASYNNIYDNNFSSNSAGYGIYFAGLVSSNNIINNNQITDNTDGIEIDSSGGLSSNNTIEYNKISYNSIEGIWSDGGLNNSNILYNNISNNIGMGINVLSMKLTNINHNYFTNNSKNGLRSIMYDCTLINNSVSENGGASEAGFYLSNSNNVSIQNNTLDNSHWNIFLNYSTDMSVVNNTISFDGNRGIYLYYTNYSNVTSNFVRNSTYHGIALQDSYNNNISKNIARFNGESGILLWGSSNNSIKNNTLTNNTGMGLWLYGNSTENSVNNNIINFNEIRGIQLGSFSSNNFLFNNIINFNDIDGIRLEGSSSNNLLFNNRLNYNGPIVLGGGVGIVVLSNYNNFSNNLINNSRGVGFRLRWENNTLINETILNSRNDGILTYNYSINTIINTTISGSGVGGTGKDIYLMGGGYIINITAINCSYDTIRFLVNGTQELTKKWYFRLNVSAKDALTDNFLSNANSPKAYIYDENNNSLQIHNITNGTTLISTSLVDYVNKDGVKTYSTPNAIFVDAENYFPSNQTIYNITSLKNVDGFLIKYLYLDYPGLSSSSPGDEVIEVIEETIIERTFCGDNICQELNDYGIHEDWYSCPSDCEGSIGTNFDEIVYSFTKNCWDSDNSTICFWTQQLFSRIPGPEDELITVCGDDLCEKNENCFNCQEDCGTFKEKIMDNLLIILLGILGIVFLSVKYIGRVF